MKLEALFNVKENKLFEINSGNQIDLSELNFISVPWSTIEIEDESYNEEFLAELRNQLKQMEAEKKFAVIVPITDKALETPEQYELFTNAFNHTARRIKDCVSVAGFELPAELTTKGFNTGSPAADFMETLAIKHAQYVYFAKCDTAPENIVKL